MLGPAPMPYKICDVVGGSAGPFSFCGDGSANGTFINQGTTISGEKCAISLEIDYLLSSQVFSDYEDLRNLPSGQSNPCSTSCGGATLTGELLFRGVRIQCGSA